MFDRVLSTFLPEGSDQQNFKKISNTLQIIIAVMLKLVNLNATRINLLVSTWGHHW